MRKIIREIENPIDNIFIDLAESTAPFYKSLNMTPNQLTTFNLLFGLTASYLFYKEYRCMAVIFYLIAY